MTKGTIFASEAKLYTDRITGLPVRQLTDYKGHSRHLYFTEDGWYDGGRRLLFLSDRDNATNLFSLHLESGEITQLTAYPDADEMSGCLHPKGTHAMIRVHKTIVELNLKTLEERLLYSCPPGYRLSNLSCTCDGLSLLTCIQEDLSDRLDLDLGNGYVGHRELMEATPSSAVIRIDLESCAASEVFRDRCFITHINASPTREWLLTFCHEGPWHLVDHRIWGLDLRSGESWKIRERLAPGEKVGHECFMPDGETIGYHGFRPDGTNFYGSIRYDNSDMEEVEFGFDTWHAYGDGKGQFVVDGKGAVKTLTLWRRMDDGRYDGPRTLCELRCSFHSQLVHAHPRITEDGKRLLFTSDRTGYANLYLIDLPENLERLPLMTEGGA